jgi:nickel-dependent lactate racemase
MVGPDKKVVVLADDVTRPTPQQQVLPPLLTALNEAGVPDRHITVIVALGTHRYMTRAEMREHFGEETCARVNVINHAWKDPDTFVDLGVTPRGTPLKVNRVAHDADVLIGVGSIVPHIYAGWGGGGKIVMPGICSAESIGSVHSLSAEGGGLLYVAGRSGTACRQEIEEAAAQVGLDFILNVVLDAEGTGAWVGAGHPVQAHAAGVAAAEKIFVRDIPAPADIAIVDARPAVIEYWQGIKALGHAARGIRKGGTAILVGDFPEGIETTHPEFSSYALCSEEEIVRAWETGRIADHVAVAPLRLHALARAHCDVICVSSGMSVEDKERLGFRHAASIGEALELALARHSRAACIGVIEFGGDVVPKVAAASP